MSNRHQRRLEARGKAVSAPAKVRHVPKPVDVSEALYWPNLNYGHQQILQQYSGYEGKVDCVIQHGVDFEPERVYPGEAYAPVCVGYSWSELRDKAWASYKPVIRGCAPFLYLMDMYKPAEAKREGTLYAPIHGTTGVKVENKNYYYHLARSLKDLPQPVTVTLYYNEMNDRDIVRQFEKNGMRVVCTVPDVNDPEVLKRQLDLFATVKYAASNDIGTNALYATALGIPYFLFGERPSWRYAVEPGMDELFAPTDEARKVWAEAAKPFEEFSEEVTAERTAVADFHLGASRKMKPAELKGALEWAASRRWPE